MASKSKKRSKRRASMDPVDLVRRSFERGDFKQALKDARVCHRQGATPELRSLLEHAYVGRAQQLLRQGLREDARRIVRELLDCGVNEPSVQAGLTELLLAVGMLDRLPGGHDNMADDERDRLQIKIADQAVLRPQETPQAMKDVWAEAEKIRAALAAVEQQDDPGAMAQLREIPRQSLFADWKFFIRGLMAYYRHDKTDMLANWDRLEENRAAAKIAAPLKFMAGVASTQRDSRLTAKVSRLEKQATSHPVLGGLLKVQQFSAQHDWPQVLRTLRTLSGELKKLDKDLYERLIVWLSGEFISESLVDELDRLARFAEPPAIDPHWNRARAVIREADDDGDSFDYWLKYLKDLESVAMLSATERNLAQAMVHLHLAKIPAEEALALQECGCGADHSEDIEAAESEAMRHFDACLALAPGYRPGYESLADFHEEADRPDEAAEIYQRWLEQTPEDLEALLYLGRYFMACDEPLKAREFAERARKLKPLDKDIGDLLWEIYGKVAHRIAGKGRFDRAREELAAADVLQPDRKDDYDMLARKAALEIKAGNAEAARALVEQAQEKLAEPTALWLAMTIEGIGFGLPKEETWLYDKRWRDALKRRCRSETAGTMCRMLSTQLQSPQPYDGCDEHVEVLRKYVGRCSRVKWQAEDLRQVCEFLDAAEDYRTLGKLLKRGLRSFPQSAQLHWLASKVEITKGPWNCDRDKAQDHLEDVIRWGASSSDPRDKELVERAKRAMSLLDGISRHEYHYDDDDEYEDDDVGSDQGIGDLLGDMEGVPRSVILAMLEKMARKMGLDLTPEEILAEIERRGGAVPSGARGRE